MIIYKANEGAFNKENISKNLNAVGTDTHFGYGMYIRNKFIHLKKVSSFYLESVYLDYTINFDDENETFGLGGSSDETSGIVVENVGYYTK